MSYEVSVQAYRSAAAMVEEMFQAQKSELAEVLTEALRMCFPVRTDDGVTPYEVRIGPTLSWANDYRSGSSVRATFNAHAISRLTQVNDALENVLIVLNKLYNIEASLLNQLLLELMAVAVLEHIGEQGFQDLQQLIKDVVAQAIPDLLIRVDEPPSRGLWDVVQK